MLLPLRPLFHVHEGKKSSRRGDDRDQAMVLGTYRYFGVISVTERRRRGRYPLGGSSGTSARYQLKSPRSGDGSALRCEQ